MEYLTQHLIERVILITVLIELGTRWRQRGEEMNLFLNLTKNLTPTLGVKIHAGLFYCSFYPIG